MGKHGREAIWKESSKRDTDPRYFVEAAAKALEVLESFGSYEEELTITEVVRRVGISYNAAFRLLYTLDKRGYVMRSGNSKKYRRTPAHKRFRIGYAALGDNLLKFSQEISGGLVLAARRGGVDLIVRDNELSPQKALTNADILLKGKIHLLIEYQLNETLAHMISSKCHEAGVPVIAIGFPQPGAYYFGGNSYVAGRLAGEFLCEFVKTKWKGKADKVLLLPIGRSSTQEARETGIRDSLKEGLRTFRPSSVVIAPPGVAARHGYRETKRFLKESASKSRRILVGAMYDGLAIGASRAVEEIGLEDRVVIVGQGGSREGRRYLQRGGPFKASVAYFPDGYGERIITLALRILAGRKVPIASYTDHVVLTSANLDQYYLPTN